MCIDDTMVADDAAACKLGATDAGSIGRLTMRILVVSNFFPPYEVGGYELGCRDVVRQLSRRGYQTMVVTSKRGRFEAGSGDTWRVFSHGHGRRVRGVLRTGLVLLAQEVWNRLWMRLAISRWKPGLIYVWNFSHISASVVLDAQRSGAPVVHYSSDLTLSSWKRVDAMRSYLERVSVRLGTRIGRMHPSLAGGAASLRLDSVQFASKYLMSHALNSGLTPRTAEVIHWGIDPFWFGSKLQTRFVGDVRLLFVGRVAAEKGVHLAIETLACLSAELGQRARLTVAGPISDRTYFERLVNEAKRLGVAERVQFTGRIARDLLPDAYATHDALLFTSLWEEPFSLTVLEAMAAGIPVVGTSTGGTPEVLLDGVTGLCAAPEPMRFSDAVLRLQSNPTLVKALQTRARDMVAQQFGLEQMVNRVEDSLMHAAVRH
jgi:glycosyltransferase involved in cell wall biosynthesis